MKSGFKVILGFAAGAAAGYLISKNMDTLVDCFDKVCYKLDDLQDQLADYRARMAMNADDEDAACDFDCDSCDDDSSCPLRDDVKEGEADVAEAAADLADDVKDIAEDVKEAASDAVEELKEKAEGAAETVAEKFEEIKEDLSDIAGDFGGDDGEVKF